MPTKYDLFTPERRYFAATNSGYGFRSFYRDIFTSCDRMYIIKGGPGTGKSSLMRTVCAGAAGRGWEYEAFYCSSDPTSLDGVIIYAPDGTSRGVIDGTAPHTAEASYPGARDEIVNLGQFWDGSALRSRLDEIKELTDRKAELFVSAYRYLAASERIGNGLRRMTLSALLNEKMQKAAERLAREVLALPVCLREYPLPREKNAVRITGGIGMGGIVHFNTLREIFPNSYLLRDRYGVGYSLLAALSELFSSADEAVIRCPDPMTPSLLRAIALPLRGVSFEAVTPDNCDEGYVKIINMERFLDRDILTSKRAKLRFARRCCETLTDGAIETFTEIRDTHFALEAIYGAAMDFTGIDSFTAEFVDGVFGK